MAEGLMQILMTISAKSNSNSDTNIIINKANGKSLNVDKWNGIFII